MNSKLAEVNRSIAINFFGEKIMENQFKKT